MPEPDQASPPALPPPPPDVLVVVHPISQDAHPTYPPGWRWAVHVGGRGPADLDTCVQAGHDSAEPHASVSGEMVGAAVCKALRMAGVLARYGYQRLDWDPMPAEADQHPIAYWGKD